MSSEPFIGSIQQVAFNYAPRGWAMCNGQLISIEQNQALFALLGITYGGNGTTTFALPDLRGRVPLHQGQGPGLSQYFPGYSGGSETVTLTQSQMPPHAHGLPAAGDQTTDRPTGNVAPAVGGSYGIPSTTVGSSATVGNGASINNMQPYLAINYIIALEGIWPTRD